MSAKDYHASTFIYKFTKPKILLGLPPTVNTLDWIVCIHTSEDLNQFKKKYNWDGMVSLKTTPFEFARMLAKIAHAYAIAELGQNAFCPLVVQIILGKTNDIGYYIGGKYDFVTSIIDDLEPPIYDAGHLLTIFYQSVITDGQPRIFIVVEVRLFASLHNTTYQVARVRKSAGGLLWIRHDSALVRMAQKDRIKITVHGEFAPCASAERHAPSV